MPELYRSMKRSADGYPECGPSRRQLGAKVPGDVTVDEGQVLPETGGMSVAPHRLMNLPQHRRPPRFGGTGKDPVFVIDSEKVVGPLTYRPDPRDETHGYIEPSTKQPLGGYQEALCQTRKDWDLK